MKNWLERTELLLKEEKLIKMQNANVLIVGMGGVGSYAAEYMVRAGLGNLTIVDGDVVDITNVNRQLHAFYNNVGQPKVTLMAERLLLINPELRLTVVNEFLSPERATEIVTTDFQYVMDCIDSLTPKLNLIISAKRKRIKVISAMGAGGKLDPSKVMVRDIHKTKNCYLAKQVRKRLKKEGFHKGVKAVFSDEIQDPKSIKLTDGTNFKKSFYGTISYMPSLFGLYAAATVIKHLTE